MREPVCSSSRQIFGGLGGLALSVVGTGVEEESGAAADSRSAKASESIIFSKVRWALVINALKI